MGCENQLSSLTKLTIKVRDINELPSVKHTINSTSEQPFHLNSTMDYLVNEHGQIYVELSNYDHSWNGYSNGNWVGNKRNQKQLATGWSSDSCSTSYGSRSIICAESVVGVVKPGDWIQVSYLRPQQVESVQGKIIELYHPIQQQEEFKNVRTRLVAECLTCGIGIDFETTPSFTFLVTVTDDNRWVDRHGDRGGNKYDVEPLSASALLIINIEDINERPWIVTSSLRTTYANDKYNVFRVTEGSPLGTPVGSPLEADDQDDETEIEWFIDPTSDLKNQFKINQIPGEKYTFKGQLAVNNDIDYEQNQHYNLIIIVKDNGDRKRQDESCRNQFKEIWDKRPNDEINSKCNNIGINRLSASVTLPVDVVDINDMTITSVQLKEGNYDKRDLTTRGGELVTIAGTNFGLIGKVLNGDEIIQKVNVSISNLDVAGNILGIQVELLGCKRTSSNILIE